jgi:hypothetical protein
MQRTAAWGKVMSFHDGRNDVSQVPGYSDRLVQRILAVYLLPAVLVVLIVGMVSIGLIRFLDGVLRVIRKAGRQQRRELCTPGTVVGARPFLWFRSAGRKQLRRDVYRWG